MCLPDTILCKPIVISSCQQFLKYKIYKFQIDNSFCIQTIFTAMRLFSWGLALWHGRLQSLSWSYPLCHAPTIYLKLEPQSAKHLVSLDAYNVFIAATITEAFSEFIKFQHFQLLISSILPKLIYFTQSLSYFKLQGTITSFMQF